MNETVSFNISINKAILELFRYINVKADIDVMRDDKVIREQYYVRLKKNSFAVLHPEISKEWNQELNGRLTPEMFYAGSNYLAWWNCPIGHEPYPMRLYSRSAGHRCPQCSGVKKYTTETFIEKLQIVNPQIKVLGDYVNNKTPIKCKCLKCNNVWYPWPADILSGSGCKKCGQLRRDASKKKKVMCVTSGKIYSSISEAAMDTGLSNSGISKSAHKQKPVCGLCWMFL